MATREVTDNWAAISDDEVMAAVRTGSASAFAVLYDRYHTQAYRIAWSVCRDNGRAEEAVQETFAAVWKTRGSYQRHVGRVAAWVLTHAATDATGPTRPPTIGSTASTSAAMSRRWRRHVRRRITFWVCSRSFPTHSARSSRSPFYGQQSHAEIAAYLELPPGTVKGRMRLGLERLRGGIER